MYIFYFNYESKEGIYKAVVEGIRRVTSISNGHARREWSASKNI